VRVVRLGVPAPAVTASDRAARRAQLCAAAGLGAHLDVVVLATLGRLVRRKGSRWFVEAVLPLLPDHVHYIVAGSGPELEPIRKAARAAGVAARVHLLGAVDDELREAVLQGADVFVQPNIAVPGDMEGFGLVTIEAALRGTPVVAAALEGILDAVVDGETGILLPPQEAQAWADRIRALCTDRGARDALGQTYRAAAETRYGEAAMRDALVAVVTPPT
jgi:phosphatidyl-myo-inositol dimannoside synthase